MPDTMVLPAAPAGPETSTEALPIGTNTVVSTPVDPPLMTRDETGANGKGVVEEEAKRSENMDIDNIPEEDISSGDRRKEATPQLKDSPLVPVQDAGNASQDDTKYPPPEVLMVPVGVLPDGMKTTTEITDGSEGPSPTDGRQLNVTDALSYLDAVKQQFVDRPDVYNQFLDIMKDFKSQFIDTPGVIERVSELFNGHPNLIQGFNTFLPAGYRIECNIDAHETNTITVTTPFGTTTSTQAQGGFGSEPVSALSTTPAAPFERVVDEIEPEKVYTHEQISPAMDYVTRIKQRFADHTDLYQEFLDILNLYKHSPVDETQLANRIAKLFQNSPDLLSGFQNFIPRGALPSAEMLGVLDGAATADRDDKPPKAAKKKVAEPSSAAASGSGVQKRKRKPAEREKEREREQREYEREREREREMKVAQSKPKKMKHQHTITAHEMPYHQQHPPSSPSFRPFGHQAGPSYPHATSQQYDLPQPPVTQTANLDEVFFFERVKRSLANREVYNEFLKLINLFTQELIDMSRLVEQSRSFLGEELLVQFKEILGWDASFDSAAFGGPSGANGHGGYNEPMERPTREELNIRYGPSYRRLPASEASVTCSGRDDMCKSVLNDEWVSHPTWASEDSGFIPHRKNLYEEALHRSEEERHEYDFHIEAIMRTIAVLEPYNMKIMQLPPEERPSYKQKMSLTGVNKSIHQRIIKKVYGRDAGLEVVEAINNSPGIAIPIVLTRLKQKEEEWKKAQREWNKVWREVDARNYQKSLDHQGITFKVNDKKASTMKAFVNQIETIREEQIAKRASLVDPTFARTRPRYQLSYLIDDVSVLQDLLKLTFSFLDRMHHQMGFPERRRIEGFLRSFVPVFFMLDPTAFNAAFNARRENRDVDFFTSLDYASMLDETEEAASLVSSSRSGRSGRRGGGGNDLRKKLLKNSASTNRKMKQFTPSISTSRPASPILTEAMAVDGAGAGPEGKENGQTVPGPSKGSTFTVPSERHPPRRGTFFTNSSLYTLLRLIELLYSRLLTCKTLSSKLASDPSSPYLMNPVASDLALLDSDAPDQRLLDLRNGSNPAAYFYEHLLESCERLFDNEIDQQTFEDVARYMFGTKAYIMFTVDKVVGSIIKQAQNNLLENKSLLLLEGLKKERDLPQLRPEDQDEIRANAEKIIGPDENLFKIDWLPDSHAMTVQLLGKDDGTFGDYDIYTGRWQAYIDSFVSDEITRGVPDVKLRPPFLSRTLRKVKNNPLDSAFYGYSGLEIKVCVRTYRMFFVQNTEDFLWREWKTREREEVEQRTGACLAFAKRWLNRFDKDGSLS